MIDHILNNSENMYRTIPVYKTFFSDTLTPIDVIQNLGDEVSYLLESKDDASAWGRYSFVGLNPYAYIKKREHTYVFEQKDGQQILEKNNLKSVIDSAMAHLKVKPIYLDIPFHGGAVGYIGYDAMSDFEKITMQNKEGLELPDYYFVFCDTHIIFDHKEKSLSVIQLVHLGECEQKEHDLYSEANSVIQELIETLQSLETKQTIAQVVEEMGEDDFKNVQSNYPKQKFIQDVEKIQEYIKNGDIFQAVLSQRFEIPIDVKAIDVYRVLRTINPSPYLFFINVDGVHIVGSSPERLVNVIDGKIEIHPIAGTRKRGKTRDEDSKLAEELIQDTKENAEHMMLVDLSRNDVGRVAKYGSVDVPMLMEVGRFSQVMHLVSKVTGQLADDKEPIDALISSFPAGTVSGAPKIRAMEIIDELEPTKRGLYAGAVGYVAYDQTIDTCIAIRTIVIKDKRAYVQAGAGIVADSVPENEWEETRNKARALIKAIHVASQYFSNREGFRYA